ncbi:hypothetical protein Hte_006394 [Hypoxylon texense]
MDTTAFDISPEKEANFSSFFYRQLFVTPQAVTLDEVDLSGKTAIVTGSNTGIGLECARQLLDLGLSKLILAVCDEDKGEAARDVLAFGHEGSIIDVWWLDLSYYNSVTKFAARARTLYHLDIVVLNAEVCRNSEVFDEYTGYEEDTQVNYLSTMLLAILMLPVLKSKKVDGRPGRLVLVSSDTAAFAKFKERDEEPLLPIYKEKSKKPDMYERYATTKLLCQLSLSELARLVPPSVAIVSLANPGLCYGSGLLRDSSDPMFWLFSILAERIIGRSCAVGARVLVDAAVKHGEEIHGHYMEDLWRPFYIHQKERKLPSHCGES